MIQVKIPGNGELALEYAVFDYNGTLAVDGKLLPGTRARLKRLASRLDVHVVTADTFGRARSALSSLPCTLTILEAGSQSEAKRAYVERLGAGKVVAFGNGRNDRDMLDAAALGLIVIQQEGACVETLSTAGIVFFDVRAAMDLLFHTKRLIATLRS